MEMIPISVEAPPSLTAQPTAETRVVKMSTLLSLVASAADIADINDKVLVFCEGILCVIQENTMQPNAMATGVTRGPFY